MTEEMRNTLRQRAADILTGYADTYVRAAEPHIRERAISDETLRQARAIERSVVARESLWRQVTAGLIATVIWTGVVVVLAIAAGDLLRDIILGSA